MLLLLAMLCLGLLPAAGRDGDSDGPVLLVLGDSLSAAYGLPLDEGWVALLQRRLKASGLAHRVVNASVSGDTSAGGLARLPAVLAEHRPVVLVIELGANDGLRGMPIQRIATNLERMIALGRAAGARVLLLGVRLPPNYGAAYTEGFQRMFVDVAARAEVGLVPRLLDGVADDRTLMQADAIHPRAAAQPRLLDNVWPMLRPLLEESDPAPVDAG